jgi:nucleoside-diphosphate-sugar epimerase
MTIKNSLQEDLDYFLSKTESLWDELRGKRIFITGGTGFFGCWLLESFVWANENLGLDAQAFVLTRSPDEFKRKAPHLAHNAGVNLCKGDIRDFEFPEGDFSFVIHAATEASAKLNERDPLIMFNTIVAGTRRCLEFARHAKTKKFLLTSSGAVYGRQPPELSHVSEDYPGAPDTMNPHWSYGEGKRCAELLCSMYSGHFGFETKIARCWAFVGPYLPLDRHFAIGNFIRDGINGGPIVINGDGTPYRSYQYAADLAVWLWTILFRAPSCRPYNVGSDHAVSIADTARTVASQCNKVEVSIAKTSAPGTVPERYVPSIERAEKELGLINNGSFEESIRKTILWHTTRNNEVAQ